jgi:hypothetical protein
MIVWRGWGILVAIVAAVAVALVQVGSNALFGEGTYARHSDWLFPLGLLLAALLIWPLGRRLNRGGERTLLDPATGQPVVMRRDHSLFFIRMEHWAPILAVAALALAVAGLLGR